MDNGISTSPDLPDPSSIASDIPQNSEQRCIELGLRWISETPEVDDNMPGLINAELAVRLRAIPISKESGQLIVVMLQPEDIEAAD
ncbi:MAG: hypothetical protein QGF07_05910, partial [Phycisphaerales bacterium]|nr:hypothetical protein [Phycisphaerales bacterium]